MLLTVTPNAALDKTFSLERFEIGKVHRPSELRVVAGGKGVIVSRVYHALGGRVTATGFLGGHTGRFIAASLHERGIPARFVETAGESRTCIAILDRSAQTQTELNEPGPEVTPEEVARLKLLFSELLDEGVSQVSMSGSLPSNCPFDFYADLIRMARERGVYTALDSSGEALRRGIEARPHLVKCNVGEMRGVLPPFGEGIPDLIMAARSLLGGGTEEVAVTMGGEGAVALNAGEAWFAAPPPVEFVSAVGSGDSFLAAYLFARERGEGLRSRLEWGVAAGAANAAVAGAGFCTREEIEHLRHRTESRSV